MTNLVNLKPTAGYVLIEPKKAETTTSSGIVLPDINTEKPQIGVVLAVGGDEVLASGGVRKSPVNEGENVIYKKWGGNEIKIDNKEYLFVKFDDILAVQTV